MHNLRVEVTKYYQQIKWLASWRAHPSAYVTQPLDTLYLIPTKGIPSTDICFTISHWHPHNIYIAWYSIPQYPLNLTFFYYTLLIRHLLIIEKFLLIFAHTAWLSSNEEDHTQCNYPYFYHKTCSRWGYIRTLEGRQGISQEFSWFGFTPRITRQLSPKMCMCIPITRPCIYCYDYEGSRWGINCRQLF